MRIDFRDENDEFNVVLSESLPPSAVQSLIAARSSAVPPKLRKRLDETDSEWMQRLRTYPAIPVTLPVSELVTQSEVSRESVIEEYGKAKFQVSLMLLLRKKALCSPQPLTFAIPSLPRG